MSYKIYDAYKISGDLHFSRINEIASNIEDSFKPHIISHIHNSAIGATTELYFKSITNSLMEKTAINDADNWRESVGAIIGLSKEVSDWLLMPPKCNDKNYVNPEDAFNFVTTNLMSMVEASNKSDRRQDNPFTSEVTIQFFSLNRHTYFRVFKQLVKPAQFYLGKLYKSYEYDYFNNKDRPTKYTEQEWESRYESWSEIYAHHSEVKHFSVSLFDSLMFHGDANPSKHLPQLKTTILETYKKSKRANTVAYYIIKKMKEAKSGEKNITIGTKTFSLDDDNLTSLYIDMVKTTKELIENNESELNDYIPEYLNELISDEEFYNQIASGCSN